MTLVKWNPSRNLLNWGDNLFEDFFNSDRLLSLNREGWYPAVDISEDDDGYHVQMELPGLTKEDVKISFKDDVLHISGEKKVEEKEEKKNYHRYERRYGKFERAFRLHSDVIVDKIDANFKNGVLIVELPKAEIAKPKEIEVKVK
jgi:HSP20 family protein